MADHGLCMSVLSNLDDFHRPLELRAPAEDGEEIPHPARIRWRVCGDRYTYVRDLHFDPGVDLKVHVNRYDASEIVAFIADHRRARPGTAHRPMPALCRGELAAARLYRR
jgi:hypothetical protein